MSARFEIVQSIDGLHWAVYDHRTGRVLAAADRQDAERVLAFCLRHAGAAPYLTWGDR